MLENFPYDLCPDFEPLADAVVAVADLGAAVVAGLGSSEKRFARWFFGSVPIVAVAASVAPRSAASKLLSPWVELD